MERPSVAIPRSRFGLVKQGWIARGPRCLRQFQHVLHAGCDIGQDFFSAAANL